MSTSGGSSGGGSPTFPISKVDATYDYEITAAGGTLSTSVFDVAAGDFGGESVLSSSPGTTTGQSATLASSNAHVAGMVAQAKDAGGSNAVLMVDNRGLTVDANGNPQWNGTLPPAPFLVATVHLNAAAIDALHSAPTQIVATPGAGKAIVVVEAFMQSTAAVVGYGSPPSPALYYLNAAGIQASAAPDGATLMFDTIAPPVARLATLPPFLNAFNAASAPITAQVANRALVVGGPFDPIRAGPIVTTTLAAGGAGYAVNDTGTIDVDIYGGGATYKVLTVSAGGHVTTFQITAAGDGYTTIDSPFTTTVGGGQPGVGVGFTVNVTAILPSDGDLYVTVYYTVITLS